MEELGTALVQARTVASQDPPTRVRWRVMALLMAFAALCHFNRISISVAGTEHIMEEFSIDETRMGAVYSAYLFVYTLCMIPGGWLIDRYGPKRAFMLMGVGSAVFVSATGLARFATPASILLVLCLIRASLGAVSVPMHPGAARVVSFWMPYRARGMANGLVTCAAVIGIASTYFVFGFLMDLVGWPLAFLSGGVATLGLTLVWLANYADHPGQHPDANESERRLIEDEDPARTAASELLEPLPGDGSDQVLAPGGGAGAKDAHPSFAALLRNRSLVLLTISYATYSYFQYLFFYWMQYYFDKVLNLGKADGRLYATIPTLAMAAGMVSGGWLADRARSRLGGWTGRSVTPVCGMIASAALLAMGIADSRPGWVVTCFTLALGTLGACEASFWVTGIALGRRRGGMSAAILNAGGNAGGILAPVITPVFSSYFGWQAGLGVASLLCVLGAGMWWWIDSSEE